MQPATGLISTCLLRDTLTFRAQEIPLDILFEDDDLIVLNKPAGLVVHPGAGHAEHTFVNALLHHCPSLSGIGGRNDPELFIGSTRIPAAVWSWRKTTRRIARWRAIRRAQVDKVYLALVAGRLRKKPAPSNPRSEGILFIARKWPPPENGGALREPITASCAKIEAAPGRMPHPQRPHPPDSASIFIISAIRFLATKFTAPKLAKGFPRQMLHAWTNCLHPSDGRASAKIRSAVPEDFSEAMKTS